ncbi:MAG: hypothetical protein ACLFMO_05755 [Eubacteriales bacterium]
MELVKCEDPHHWIMIQHWISKEEAKLSSKEMMKSPIAEKFRNSLDSKTVKLRYLDQVKTWK